MQGDGDCRDALATSVVGSWPAATARARALAISYGKRAGACRSSPCASHSRNSRSTASTTSALASRTMLKRRGARARCVPRARASRRRCRAVPRAAPRVPRARSADRWCSLRGLCARAHRRVRRLDAASVGLLQQQVVGGLWQTDGSLSGRHSAKCRPSPGHRPHAGVRVAWGQMSARKSRAARRNILLVRSLSDDPQVAVDARRRADDCPLSCPSSPRYPAIAGRIASGVWSPKPQRQVRFLGPPLREMALRRQISRCRAK